MTKKVEKRPSGKEGFNWLGFILSLLKIKIPF